MNKNRSVVEWAMHYRSIVILITCCLVAFGMFALNKMKKNEFPDFTVRQGVVVAVYPGATASDIEEQVTKPLEDYIFTYKEVRKEKTKSFSRHGISIVQVELNAELTDKDAFWSKFKHGISQFKSQLPSGVLAVQVNDDFGDTSALLITLESGDKTYREMDDYMDDLQDRLSQVESVGRMNVLGMLKEQISVYVDNNRLSQYGITGEALTMALMSKGFVTMAGTLKEEGYNSPVYVKRSMNMENDVESMIVYSTPTGTNVRLRDIATVRREYAEPSSYVTTGGNKCLVLSVEMKKGRNITAMGDEIDKVLEEFETGMPDDVSIFKVTDQAQVVHESVVNFIEELLIAIVAVVVVVLLLMPMRVALVASSTIPISIFISLGLFYAFNIELNTVTLAALIVTLGMIVDNAIVIIDSYVDMLAEGKRRWEASIQSARHFFKSIFVATLAISITFFPFLITLDGMFNDFLQAFPWAITIVLGVSLLVAELVVPFLQFYFIREPLQLAKTGKEPVPTDLRSVGSGSDEAKPKFSFLTWIQTKYDKIIDKCFAHPYLTVACGVASVVLAILLMQFMPIRLMPTAERNQFAVEIYLPTGTSVKKTAEIADSLEHILEKDSRVVSIASFKGMASPRFQTAYAPQFASESYAQFIVNTLSEDATVEILDEYAPKYHDAFPGAYVLFRQLAYSTVENPIEVRVTGSDWAKVKQVADTVMRIMRFMPEIWLARNDAGEPLMTTKIILDEDKASRLGINNTSVELALATRFNSDGLAVATIWNGDYDMNICLKGAKADRATPEELADELIPVMGGVRQVPLREIASVTTNWEDGQIAHRGGMRTITVKGEVERGKNVTQVSRDLKKKVAEISLPDGVKISYGGELENNEENIPKIAGGLAIAVAIIFFLLLWHYKDVSTAVLLLVSLSLTLPGMVIGIFIQGIDFSITCCLGIISLMGILVRNAIIMFDYAEELREKEHMKAMDAIYTSAKRRLRPIFLTSAAASMGVIPMILGGTGLWMPMGAVICYGTIITMFFILTILPVSYSLVQSGSTRRRQQRDLMEKQ